MATFTARDLTLAAVAAVRILGIDPGTLVVGYACLEVAVGGARGSGGDVPLAMRASNVVRVGGGGGEDVRLLVAGALDLGGRHAPLPVRLRSLADQFAGLLRSWTPHEVAIEEAFYGKSVQAALRIGEARGVVLAESARAGLEVHQFAPARVKRCVTGRGAAGKDAVAAMVGQLVQHGRQVLHSSLPRDATDAVAVAWTRLEQRRSPLVMARAVADPPDRAGS
ncbi:MAG: crossover junction endodeoxyribonuclease RuvC [Planctomycetes bacterium]|nr:crossover junction endodeoxyribonuclease RuvC [Planctomycetota bacterium]